MLLAGLVALALVGCGGGSADTQSTDTTDNSEVAEQEATTDAEEEAPDAEEEVEEEAPLPTIEPTVVYDNNDIKITATSLTEGEYENQAVLTLHLENNRSDNVEFDIDSGSINGYMENTLYYNKVDREIPAGTSADWDIEFYTTDLEDLGIEAIANIELALSAHTEELASFEFIHYERMSIDTSAAATYTQEYDDSGDVIYDDNRTKIIYKGRATYDGADEKDCFLRYEIINEGDHPIKFWGDGVVNGGTGEERINGLDAFVMPGKRWVGNIYVDGATVNEDGSVSFESVVHSGEVVDAISDEGNFEYETSPVTP